MADERYPAEWKRVARAVKVLANWRCVRCGHRHELPGKRLRCDARCDASRHPGGLNDGRQRVLTVHHLDGDKHNLRWWNLAPLCQVCHLVIQRRVVMERPWMLPHSRWFKPYVAGYYAWAFLEEELTRRQVELRLEELLALQPRMEWA